MSWMFSKATGFFLIIAILLFWLNSVEKDFHVPDFLTLTKSHGRDAELYNVTTEDGYILPIFRLPPNPKYYNITDRKGVIFIQPPLMASADIYVLFGPNRSLAHSLSNAGYDVWLGNHRGNTYGRRHTTLSPDDSEFWNFNIDDWALRDLPVLIDYILEAANTSSVSYIGYSLSTTTGLMLLADKPEYNSKINSVILLAPVAYWTVQNPTRNFLIKLCRVLQLLTPMGAVECLPQNGVISRVFQKSCFHCSFTRRMCHNVFGFIIGYHPEQFQMHLWQFLSHWPAGMSVQAMYQYTQNIENGTLRHFDYKSKELNFKHYGTDEPPEYNVTSITSPVVLIYSRNDPLATIEDTLVLAKKLPSDTKVFHHLLDHDKFNHGDYAFSPDAERLVYKYVIEILAEFH